MINSSISLTSYKLVFIRSVNFLRNYLPHCLVNVVLVQGGILKEVHEKNPHFELQLTFGTELTKSETVLK